MPISDAPRRSFLRRLAGFAGLSAAAAAPSPAQNQTREGASGPTFLSRYARAQNYKSLKQSSFDRSGGNADSWPIAPGATQELFNSSRAGRHHAHLVHHRRREFKPSQGNRDSRLLGRKSQAQHRSAGGRFLRPESRPVFRLPIGVSELLVNQSPELVLRHAISQIGAAHGHQRGHAEDRRVLFEYRLPACAFPSRRHALLSRAVPPGDAQHGAHGVATRIPTGGTTTSTRKRAAAAI